jgi:murein DD-endopeptidase MepM/ murein hydrolase activator NlpD
MVDSVRRTPANNTRKLLDALAPLEQFGLDPTQRAVVGFGRFPVAGVATWTDDWWFPRFGPGWRLHQGLDIFATYGTPVRAPVDGTVRIKNGGLGGIAVYVVQPDKTYWYLAHLAGVVDGLVEGATVKTGQVVGYVGDSGNARGGAPHVHLEVHPRGGGPIPPKPIVDKFVADAITLAPQLIQAYAAAPQQAAGPTPAVVAPPEPELVTLSPRKALLWASAANPAGGTLRLVEADARDAASRIDWARVEAAAIARKLAEERAWLMLRPLVPDALARAISAES